MLCCTHAAVHIFPMLGKVHMFLLLVLEAGCYNIIDYMQHVYTATSKFEMTYNTKINCLPHQIRDSIKLTPMM